MILNGCFVNSRFSNLIVHDRKPCSIRSHNSSISSIPYSNKKVVSLSDRSFWGPSREVKSSWLGIQQIHLSAASAPLLHGEHGSLSRTVPKLPKRPHRPLSPRASKDVPQSSGYPPMTRKPRWWWRSLACVPYLLPLHETWMYAETTRNLLPLFEYIEPFTYPLLEALARLPSWFLMAYFFIAYLGIVRRKEWPHFFRFHMIMGMLLEISLQVIGTVCRWVPSALYWGKIGLHFWTAVFIAHWFTVLQCILCALGGVYADVPFACDAAYLQMPHD